MHKVTTINLNGRAYQLEEGGEAILRKYLETAGAKLAGNPDKDEIMADFEQAIADKFDQKLTPHKNVISEKEIGEIIAAMGPVDEESANADNGSTETKNAAGETSSGGAGKNSGAPKRLYRVPAGEWIMGVCNGLAAYFNIDVTLVRIVWVILTIITHGFWILAYIVLAIIMPPAKTDEEYSAAHGWQTRAPLNAHDFIEQAKARYAELHDNLQKMHDEHKAVTANGQQSKEEIKAWAKKMKMEMREKKQKMKQEWRMHRREAYSAYGPYENHPGEHQSGMHNFSRAIFGFFAVIVSIMLLALGVAWATAFYTLIKYGTVFGYAMGAGHPLWVSIVFLFAAFYVVTIPFRLLLQHAWGNARFQSGWQEFGRTLVFLAMLVVLFLTARALFPQVDVWWHTGISWLNTRT